MLTRILLLLGACLTLQAQIAYPVDVENDRFTFIQGTNLVRNVRWPRADGMALENAPETLRIYRQAIAPLPTFDPATHKLGALTWTEDDVAQTATLSRGVVPLSAEEIAARTAEQERIAKRQDLQAAIATLRTWADQAEATTVTSQNAVATLQTMVNRLGIFFEHFANLLEVEEIR